MLERAATWQQEAQQHNWSDDLQMQPVSFMEEDWWYFHGPQDASVNLASNPYTIAMMGLEFIHE